MDTLRWLLRALERGEYRLKSIVLEDDHCHRVTTTTLATVTPIQNPHGRAPPGAPEEDHEGPR